MTSHLVIDGNNVIFALDRYRSAGDFETARELLIHDAFKAAGWTGRDVHLVFDAGGGPDSERTELRAGGAVRITYSATGKSADDVIEHLLPRLDGPTIVYTADFALQRAALAQGSIRATPREFSDLLDELPAVTRSPHRPRTPKIGDHISPETMLALERLRRRDE